MVNLVAALHCKEGLQPKKKPRGKRGFAYNKLQVLQLADILGRRTFGAFYNVEFDPGTLIKGFVAFCLDCGMMNENVFASVLSDKAETLCCIKPFNCTFCHFYYSF
jgi:hypothetical protein